MKIDELVNEEMFCLCAPDGSLQLSSLAPEYAMCIGFCELLASSGMGQSVAEMFKNGFNVMPVKVTITQNGDEESAFQKAKRKWKR